jgi:DNA-binding NarL/FixJ family response regulator
MHTSIAAPKAVAKVFIVDDHPTVREGLGQFISRESDLSVAGFADDLDAALRGIAESEPDVVVVDMGLKTSSGLDLVKRLHEKDPRIAILVWSMHEASLFGSRAMKAGAMSYVSKSQSTEDVIEAIRAVRRRGASLDVSVEESEASSPRKSPSAARAGGHAVEDLSDRELQVFQMLGDGMSMTQIVARTQLSPKTIETYRARIKQKLELGSHAELLRHAIQWTLERKS